ncbi:MAG: preprotein translocase subunit SecA [Patescibacteria group bacterium]|nr:preprotein translocase subunit SecA [Patescibacteria group bacterium]MCL5431510.1 preprotein translocase subunit SecA [Patescibacteria group bacterium]
MLNFLTKFLDSNDKEVKRLWPLVEAVNNFEPKVKKLKDKDFAKKTAELKLRLERGESLDDLLPEAFAAVREASFRVNNERHFDVQILAGVALHQGKIAEQKTGEGKTLSASPALYLNALTGRGVHLVTVNDYLARRDAGWMGAIYHFLGLSTAAMVHEASFLFDPDFTDETATDWRLRHLRPISRKEAYGADITYGINSEFGFDYLRDNMARSLNDVVQREFHYAIVDEVDSVLIDEARTPHIISAPDAQPTQKYYEYAQLVEKLTPTLDFVIDEKLRTAHLTDHGVGKVEQLLGLKDIYEKDFATVHHIEAALKARTLYQREKDYIVKEGEVIIVDEFTGRLMPGRRWSEGIHQAVEAKEHVTIQQESRTLATISLQNYFRKYEKLAGMTGTAVTESEEFHKIYNLSVVVIPTHRPLVRSDHPDQVYKTQRAKYAAVVRDIEENYKKGRPVLVGTTSIEKNEIISQFLHHRNIPHQVLNAKQHEKEAMILANAGKKGTVTVATNMAGRGVDIVLGGDTPKGEDGRPLTETPQWKKWLSDHDEVVAAGGLHVIGTERHESRRIDNQLRGRAGRQGDPGSSRFFVALDDDIMRLFGGEQVSKLMTFFNIPEDQPLEHGMVTRAIEQAQSKVEQFNFDSRKHLLEYDDVMNKQREIIYDMRSKVLVASGQGSELRNEILGKIDKEITVLTAMYTTPGSEDPGKLVEEFTTIVPFDENSKKQILEQISRTHNLEPSNFLVKIAHDVYQQREKQIGDKMARYIEQQEMLWVIDGLWMEHLEAIDDLREGIGLRGYGQRDPLVEYKSEAFAMFEKLIAAMDFEIVHSIFKIAVATPEQVAQMQQLMTNANQLENQSPVPSHSNQPLATSPSQKPGRNDPCWCGSGKKYKFCHLDKDNSR